MLFIRDSMKSFRDTLTCSGISIPISLRQLATQNGLHLPISLEGLIKTIISAPRSFYIVGHNPNTISEVISALNLGANAIEPDVNVYKDHQDQTLYQ